MSGTIYLLQDDDTLAVLRQEPYDSEALLQRLLARHPALLAGEQVDQAEPRRWLLVRREMRVPDQEDGPGRWSLDHLFLDQDGVPTLVEVKRASDTRVRREVVAQMLDYAANAVLYWPLERIQSAFEATCAEEAADPDEHLAAFLDDGHEVTDFWQQVRTNLQAGRVRLVFVADEIPASLRRIVEFLNEQMDPAEVLALEVKQYVGEGQRTLVPRLLGQTAAAERKKAVGGARAPLTEEGFYAALAETASSEAIAAARRVLTWAQERGLRIYPRQRDLKLLLDVKDGSYGLVSLERDGTVRFHFRHVAAYSPFNTVEARDALRRALNAIDGIDIDQSQLGGFPKVSLEVLAEPAVLERFLEVQDEFVAAARNGRLPADWLQG